MLTGIRDLDREIVNKLSDKDLLNMCLVNRTYWERVCDDSYFRLRTLARFPETVPYKDYINENEGKTKRTWKNHYLNIVKYIDLLQRNYRYIYRAEDKSPELLYLARKSVPEYYSYTKNKALIYASRNGHLPVVKYLTEHGGDITALDNEAVIWASRNGHLPVVKYLVENGADITDKDNYPVRWASLNVHLPVVKYLVKNGADITAQDNTAVIWASQNGHLSVVKYLLENGVEVTTNNNYAVRCASRNGHLEIVKYLVEHGADLTARDNI